MTPASQARPSKVNTTTPLASVGISVLPNRLNVSSNTPSSDMISNAWVGSGTSYPATSLATSKTRPVMATT